MLLLMSLPVNTNLPQMAHRWKEWERFLRSIKHLIPRIECGVMTYLPFPNFSFVLNASIVMDQPGWFLIFCSHPKFLMLNCWNFDLFTFPVIYRARSQTTFGHFPPSPHTCFPNLPGLPDALAQLLASGCKMSEQVSLKLVQVWGMI